MLLVGGTWNSDVPSLQVPANYHLGRGHAMGLGDSRDHRIIEQGPRVAASAQREPALQYGAVLLADFLHLSLIFGM